MPRHIEILGATGYESKSVGRFALPAKNKRVARNLKSCPCKKLEAIEVWKLIVHNGFVLVPFSALNQGKVLNRILNPGGTGFF